MNFVGVIDRITKTAQGVEVRLSKSFYLDENIVESIRVIRAAECATIPQEILDVSGEEIDGYDVDSEGITLWVNWHNNGEPIKITASQITEEDRPYEIEDYSRALAAAHETYERQAKEIHQLRRTIKEFTAVLDHELDNLNRRTEFDPSKAEKYKKALDILTRLRKISETT